MRTILAMCAAAGAVTLAGCMTAPPATLGTPYACDRGTQLQVSYLGEGALVRINGGRAVALRATPSNGASVYEGRGNRLARDGNTVTWNTAARSAPETCRAVNTVQ